MYILGTSRVRESEDSGSVYVPRFGSYLSYPARFVSTQNGRSERREQREGVGWW